VQIPLLPHGPQSRIQPKHHLLVRPTLEGDTLTLVVESETEVERDGDTLFRRAAGGAGFDDTADEGFGVEGRGLAARGRRERGERKTGGVSMEKAAKMGEEKAHMKTFFWA
jgi:hypothetical protein